MGFFTADFCDTCKEEIQVLGAGFTNFGGKKKMKGALVTVKLNENNQELIRVLDEAGPRARGGGGCARGVRGRCGGEFDEKSPQKRVERLRGQWLRARCACDQRG